MRPSMDIYTVLLTAAGAAAVAGCVLAVLTRLDLHRARLVQWPPLLGGLAIVLAVAAGAYHLLAAHGPDSPAPMEPIGFVSEHPTLLLVAALALLALGVNKSGR